MRNSTISSLPPDKLSALLRAAELEVERRAATNKLRTYKPYPKQAEFHREGKIHRERLLIAANQVGKSYSGAAEMSYHLTGLYPDWWEGRTWDRAIRAWAGSQTGEVTRDGVQRILVGEPKDEAARGTGFIPKDLIIDCSRRQHVADALDSITVRHASGGTSTLGFKSYDQGRQKWQAETLDAVWLDEECPYDLYMEALTRTNATDGMLFMTFTPLLGMSSVVRMFLGEDGTDDIKAVA
jgi:phage terminase large subunit-like protein